MNKKILVVDDSSTMRKLVGFILESQGYEVVLTANGPDALEKLKNEKFDAAIIDLIMPVIDGFNLFSRIKEDEKNKNLPCVMLTTEGDWRNIRKSKKLGLGRYLVKPFKPRELLDVVEELTCNNN